MNVVMGLGPVMTDEYSFHRHLLVIVDVEPEVTSSFLMVQCSRHVIPPAIEVDLTNQQAHGLGVVAQGTEFEKC